MRIAVLYGFLLSLIALLDIFIFVTCGLLGMLIFHKSYCTLLVPGYKATIELEQNNIDEFTVFFFFVFRLMSKYLFLLNTLKMPFSPFR